MDQLGGLLYLFLTVCIGYGAAATKLLSEKAAETLPQLLFNICYPAMILETFLTVDTSVLLGTGLPIAAATVAVTLVLFVSGLWAFRKQPEEQKALYTFLMGVGNVTYVAIPLFSALLPAEAVLAAIIHSTAQDPLIWGIYHPLLLKSTEGQENMLKQVLSSPCLIATLAGIVLCVTKIPLPGFLVNTAARISAATSPVALILIGMLVYQYGFFSWIRDKRALLYSVLKVLVLPLVLFVVFLPFLNRVDAILLAILFGSPAPLMSIAWAKQHHSDVAFTVHCFLSSTLLFLPAVSILVLILSSMNIL